MTGKLRIFVSGKEGELDDERATTIDMIISLGFTPVSSEKRPASSDSMEEEYLGEVRSSDIYIGIFGVTYSEPTINEFDTARTYNLCTLVFEKNLPDGIQREAKLVEFLQKIKNTQSGLVVSKFNNVIDLRKKIIDALSSYLTKKFKEAQKLQKNEKEFSNTQFIIDIEKNLKQSFNAYDNLNDISKLQYSFGVRYSEEFGKIKFVNFTFPNNLQIGKNYIISAKIEGSTHNGFLDLAFIDPDGIYYWFPDPQSYDSVLDNGKLIFENESHSAIWEYSVPQKIGKYTAIMALYEDKFENRKCVNYEKREFTVI